MRVLVAFDKFKDALPARAACEAAAHALRAKHPDWTLDLCPLTDGGEGFCETLTAAAQGRLDYHVVSGPRGGLVHAPVGFVDAKNIPAPVRDRLNSKRRLAIVDLPSASGIGLLPADRRDPWHTTTHGTG